MQQIQQHAPALAPLGVLRAIARTEAGRENLGEMEPWRWTVNMRGKGAWFDTKNQAHVCVCYHFKEGVCRFNVACFQNNYEWWNPAFGSIEEMFDPLLDKQNPATYLGQIHSMLCDWENAVGANHSGKHKHAHRFLCLFAEIRAALEPAIPTVDAFKTDSLLLCNTSCAKGTSVFLFPFQTGPQSACRALIRRVED